MPSRSGTIVLAVIIVQLYHPWPLSQMGLAPKGHVSKALNSKTKNDLSPGKLIPSTTGSASPITLSTLDLRSSLLSSVRPLDD